jgi:hypothetical protein
MNEIQTAVLKADPNETGLYTIPAARARADRLPSIRTANDRVPTVVSGIAKHHDRHDHGYRHDDHDHDHGLYYEYQG